ncbi:MAG: type II toxin-antitoxin system HicA family toxin [Candidatus Hydrothermarchaeales archaeon]
MKLRPLPPEKVIRALEKSGFVQVRQKGSHIFMRHPDGRTTVVTYHKREDIGRGLLRKIIRDTKMSVDEFMHLV